MTGLVVVWEETQVSFPTPASNNGSPGTPVAYPEAPAFVEAMEPGFVEDAFCISDTRNWAGGDGRFYCPVSLYPERGVENR